MKYINVFNPTSKSFTVNGIELKSNESINIKPYTGDNCINYMTALRRSGMTVSLINVKDTIYNETSKAVDTKIEEIKNNMIKDEVVKDNSINSAEINVNTEETEDNVKVDKAAVEEKVVIENSKEKETSNTNKQTEVKSRKKPGPKPKAKTDKDSKSVETKTTSKTEKSSSEEA